MLPRNLTSARPWIKPTIPTESSFSQSSSIRLALPQRFMTKSNTTDEGRTDEQNWRVTDMAKELASYRHRHNWRRTDVSSVPKISIGSSSSRRYHNEMNSPHVTERLPRPSKSTLCPICPAVDNWPANNRPTTEWRTTNVGNNWMANNLQFLQGFSWVLISWLFRTCISNPNSLVQIASCEFHRVNFIARVPSCEFHRAHSIVRTLSHNSIVRGFHRADSIVRIPLCEFHCADSIVRILSCKPYCTNSIVYEFYRTFSVVRVPSCWIPSREGMVEVWRPLRRTVIFSRPFFPSHSNPCVCRTIYLQG